MRGASRAIGAWTASGAQLIGAAGDEFRAARGVQPSTPTSRPAGRRRQMTIADTRTRWLALIVLCLGDLMIVLDVTIVGVALPSIREDLGFSEESLAWVVNAYLLTFGGFLLLGGRLGDIVGHRRMFLAGISLFTARVGRLRPREHAGAPGRRARGAGRRRRDRLRRRALAHHHAVHRAGGAREGDGRLRVRRLRRRLDRRAARRRPHRRARLALDLPRQRPRSASPSSR